MKLAFNLGVDEFRDVGVKAMRWMPESKQADKTGQNGLTIVRPDEAPLMTPTSLQIPGACRKTSTGKIDLTKCQN